MPSRRPTAAVGRRLVDGSAEPVAYFPDSHITAHCRASEETS
jgi:hypothetical protein